MKAFSQFISVVLLNFFAANHLNFDLINSAFFKAEAEEKAGFEASHSIATIYERNQNKQSLLLRFTFLSVLADMVSHKNICFSSYLRFFCE